MTNTEDHRINLYEGFLASSLPSRGQFGWLIALLVVVVINLGVVIALLINGQESEPQKWEYKIEAPQDVLFEIKVNELGREGWELVTARRATGGSGYGDSASYEMIFKRPLAKGAVDPAKK